MMKQQAASYFTWHCTHFQADQTRQRNNVHKRTHTQDQSTFNPFSDGTNPQAPLEQYTHTLLLEHSPYLQKKEEQLEVSILL
jgi:hypothetical protein